MAHRDISASASSTSHQRHQSSEVQRQWTQMSTLTSTSTWSLASGIPGAATNRIITQPRAHRHEQPQRPKASIIPESLTAAPGQYTDICSEPANVAVNNARSSRRLKCSRDHRGGSDLATRLERWLRGAGAPRGWYIFRGVAVDRPRVRPQCLLEY